MVACMRLFSNMLTHAVYIEMLHVRMLTSISVRKFTTLSISNRNTDFDGLFCKQFGMLSLLLESFWNGFGSFLHGFDKLFGSFASQIVSNSLVDCCILL